MNCDICFLKLYSPKYVNIGRQFGESYPKKFFLVKCSVRLEKSMREGSNQIEYMCRSRSHDKWFDPCATRANSTEDTEFGDKLLHVSKLGS